MKRTQVLSVLTLALVALAVAGCGEDEEPTQTPANNVNNASANNADDAGNNANNAGDVSDDASDNNTADADAEPDVPEIVDLFEPEFVITADFLAGTLSIYDFDPLVAGEAPTPATIDLSMYAPGPLQLELTPDGTRAVVSAAPGFYDGTLGGFAGASDVAAGGSVLIVNLETKTVEAEVITGHEPMGIAISPDGTRAYTANFGADGARGTTMSVIDLTAGTLIEDLEVGNGPEQVALNEDGTVGILNLANEDGVKVFQTSDPGGTLTALLPTGDDTSDVTFIPGTDYAVVVHSNSINAALIDVSDPAAPAVVDDALRLSGIPYGVDAIPGDAPRVVMTGAGNPSMLIVAEVVDGKLEAVGEPIATSGSTFPLNAAVDANGHYAFVPHPLEGSMSIVDLRAGTSEVIDWLEPGGPTYVRVY